MHRKNHSARRGRRRPIKETIIPFPENILGLSPVERKRSTMKKLCHSVMFAVVFLAFAAGVEAQTSASAFAGAWVLDKEKTSPKDLPKKLQTFQMLVAESENLLNVKSQYNRVEVEVSRDRSNSVGPNVSLGTVAGSTVGQSSGGSGTTSAGQPKASYGGTLALAMTPNAVTYNLDGKEEKVEIKKDDKVIGVARIKAKLDKNGKTLQLTTIRRQKTPYGEMETSTWESWKLSGDGKSLKFQRTVETPTQRDELTMMLMRPAQP